MGFSHAKGLFYIEKSPSIPWLEIGYLTTDTVPWNENKRFLKYTMNWILYTYSRLFVKKIKKAVVKNSQIRFVTAVDSGAAAILCPTSRTTIRRHVFKRPPRALVLLRLAANFIMQSCWGKSLLRKKVCCQSCQTYHLQKKGT